MKGKPRDLNHLADFWHVWYYLWPSLSDYKYIENSKWHLLIATYCIMIIQIRKGSLNEIIQKVEAVLLVVTERAPLKLALIFPGLQCKDLEVTPSTRDKLWNPQVLILDTMIIPETDFNRLSFWENRILSDNYVQRMLKWCKHNKSLAVRPGALNYMTLQICPASHQRLGEETSLWVNSHLKE